MKTVVIYPKCSSVSAKKLALVIKADAVNPFDEDKRDFRKYDLVINYGCNRNFKFQRIINHPLAVSRCIDKLATFGILERAGVNVPRYTTDLKVAATYEVGAARIKSNGNKNDGLVYYEKGKPLPKAELYTEYFFHKKEFRVVVLNGIIIACYEKVEIKGEWEFHDRTYKYLEPVKEHCIRAARALGIDYVGFDVVVNDEKEFVILEANSGPIITDEVVSSFKSVIRRVKREI